jgi:Animal haem peroxidase
MDTNKTDTTGLNIPQQLKDFLSRTAISANRIGSNKIAEDTLQNRVDDLGLELTVPIADLLDSANLIDTTAKPNSPEEVRASVSALNPETRRVHGAKLALAWFPFPSVTSPCTDRFGYMSSETTRTATKLPFNVANQALLAKLGNLMGDPGRDQAGDSSIPAGYTYFGQFVDHDITLDVSSSLDAVTDAKTINNMRSPALDLDSVYGRGPGLDPFLYVFPSSGPPTAIKFQTGTNTDTGAGGPGGANGVAGMIAQTSWDVPRVSATQTAVIGDPRNDENLIVSQLHHAMLRFHNSVVDLLLLVEFPGDIFAEAKRMVIHHYQWAVVNDFLKRICGATAVSNALTSVVAPIGSPFSMPVEFAVAAYRFGHSIIRDRYWVNFNFPFASLGEVFQFIRSPQLPVFSNWVVDFNAFFDTGVWVPVNNKARKIDSFMANGLENLPGLSGMLAILATRNLRRSLALGLPSGQGMASSFGIAPMTAAQLTSGLPANEVTVLNSSGGLLLSKTPLWYYILREAAVLGGGNQLGPVGGRIVAETFIRMLKRDASSYLNAAGGFTPILPSIVDGDFTVADLVIFAGVTTP